MHCTSKSYVMTLHASAMTALVHLLGNGSKPTPWITKHCPLGCRNAGSSLQRVADRVPLSQARQSCHFPTTPRDVISPRDMDTQLGFRAPPPWHGPLLSRFLGNCMIRKHVVVPTIPDMALCSHPRWFSKSGRRLIGQWHNSYTDRREEDVARLRGQDA